MQTFPNFAEAQATDKIHACVTSISPSYISHEGLAERPQNLNVILKRTNAFLLSSLQLAKSFILR